MIITRSPLRISIGGGGTDLPSYYEEHGGFLIAMALTHHVYISLQRKFDPGITLKYSQIENVASIEEIKHPIIREALKLVGIRETDFEITSVADVPAGTGLGSSGSFTTALLKALHILAKRHVDTKALAEMACHIEMDLLKEPIGKQDQYIAAYGGLTAFTFEKGGVQAESLPVADSVLEDIEDNVLMFFTGRTRSASNILKEQDTKSKTADQGMIDNLNRVKDLGYQTQKAFLSGDLGRWGEIMLEHWEAKKKRSGGMSNPAIDEWYDLALKNGAIGGKLVGAGGGGGFLLFYADNPNKLRRAMNHAGLKELFVHMDVEGTKVVSR